MKRVQYEHAKELDEMVFTHEEKEEVLRASMLQERDLRIRAQAAATPVAKETRSSHCQVGPSLSPADDICSTQANQVARPITKDGLPITGSRNYLERQQFSTCPESEVSLYAVRWLICTEDEKLRGLNVFNSLSSKGSRTSIQDLASMIDASMRQEMLVMLKPDNADDRSDLTSVDEWLMYLALKKQEMGCSGFENFLSCMERKIGLRSPQRKLDENMKIGELVVSRSSPNNGIHELTRLDPVACDQNNPISAGHESVISEVLDHESGMWGMATSFMFDLLNGCQCSSDPMNGNRSRYTNQIRDSVPDA